MKVKTRRLVFVILGALVLSALPGTAYAHPGDPTIEYGSFLAGLTHPVLGLDHFLAMLSVGIISAQIGGRAIWTVPTTFVSVMALGGLLGVNLPGFTLVEAGIAISVLFLGTVIAIEKRLPILAAMIAVAFFATLHGYAHGIEIPSTARPFVYAGGFLTGTALIHILGVFLGDIPRHYESGKLFLRVGGAAIAVAGLLFLFGVL